MIKVFINSAQKSIIHQFPCQMVLLSDDYTTYYKVQQGLQKDPNEAWMKLAQATGIPDVIRRTGALNDRNSPAEALLKYLTRNKVTVEQLILLLEKAELFKILVEIRGIDPLCIISVTPEESELEVALKKPLLLCVEAEGSFPIYQWFKNGILCEEKSNRLIIANFQNSDEGEYVCEIRHNPKYVDHHSTLQHRFILKPQSCPPSITSILSDVIVNEGDKIDLKCDVDGYPPPSTIWHVYCGDHFRKLQSNLIENASLDDSGLYECFCWNEFGQVRSRKIKVQVKPKEVVSSKPIILTQPSCGENATRSIGENVVLCLVVRSSMNVNFRWSINGNFLDGITGLHYNISNNVDKDTYTHRSFLTYVISHRDPVGVKFVCYAQSPDGTVLSDEVNITVQSSSRAKHYKAHRKIALLVGNSDYKSQAPTLITPKEEICRLASKLQQLDFEVLALYDVGLTELKETIKMIASIVTPQDYVLFLYGGHGYYDGEDQLQTVPQPGSHGQDTLSLTNVLRLLQQNRPALVFCILDMCRHLPVQPNQKHEVSAMPSSNNYICLHATSEGHTALENRNETSVLAASLLKHLEQPVEVQELCNRIIEDIGHQNLYVRKHQIPKLTSNLLERRSLCDPKTGIEYLISVLGGPMNSFYWNLLRKLPREHTCEVRLSTTRIVKLSVSFDREIKNVLSNTFYLHVNCPQDLEVSLQTNFPVKAGSKRNRWLIEEAQKMKDPLKFAIKCKYVLDNGQQEKLVHMVMDLPGIAKLNLPNQLIPVSSIVARPNMNVV